MEHSNLLGVECQLSDPLQTRGCCETLLDMKAFLLTLAVAMLCGCSDSRGPRDRIMDEIEHRIALPPGAHPLGDYARYYAFDEKGRVWGVYELPGPPPSRHQVCKDMNGAVAPEKWRTTPCPKQSREESYLAAGERRWMSDSNSIPLSPDILGCEQIDFTYDARGGTFVSRPSCPDQKFQFGRAANGR